MIDKQIRRYKIIEKHIHYTAHGMYDEAKLLLKLLINGSVKLGLEDYEAIVEFFLEDIGCKKIYSRDFCIVKFTL